jgi:CDP-diacylglycerol--serine O-phosphatidyltransferase
MENTDSQTQNGRKGIYFLPSLFTTAGLFFGFYAIIQATQGNFASLVDVIAFGLAPGMIMYFWSLQYLGKTGWLIAFLYTAATALRLARFNTLTIKDNRYFYGLACPAAGAFIVFWVWNFEATEISGQSLTWLSALVTAVIAVLMVSNIKFRSFKDFDPKHKIPFFVLIAIVGFIVLISFDPPRVLFLMALAYAGSGPIGWVIRRQRGIVESPAFLPDEDDDEGDNSEQDTATASKQSGSKTGSKVESIAKGKKTS